MQALKQEWKKAKNTNIRKRSQRRAKIKKRRRRKKDGQKVKSVTV